MQFCRIGRQGGNGTETGWCGGVDLGRSGYAVTPRAGAVRGDARRVAPPARRPAPLSPTITFQRRSGPCVVSPSSPGRGPGSGGPSTSTPGSLRGAGRTRPCAPTMVATRFSWTTSAIHATAGRRSADREVGEITVPLGDLRHDPNRAVHVADYEGRPARRPLTRGLSSRRSSTSPTHAVEEAARSARKGWLPAFRDATLYQGDLRLGTAAHRSCLCLDVGRLFPQPRRLRAGPLRDASMSGSQKPCAAARPGRRRAVASVMPWAVESGGAIPRRRPPAPRGARPWSPAMWLTERGTRISSRRIDERFSDWRACRRASLRALGALPAPQLHLAPHRRRRRPAVRPAPGGATLGRRRPPIYTTVGASHANARCSAPCARPHVQPTGEEIDK